MSLSVRTFPTLLIFLMSALLPLGTASAEDKNVTDYTLRLHIFNREEHTHYRHGVADFTQGDGRANLYAQSEVHAVDFHFNCGQKIEHSIGYETYMAKWRKPGKQLTVLFPVFGQTGKYFTCDLDTDVKPDLAYVGHGSSIDTEPAADFKAWMTKHNYDPERNKNTPTNTDPSE